MNNHTSAYYGTHNTNEMYHISSESKKDSLFLNFQLEMWANAQRVNRAVATFEATEAAASVVFRTVASVKTLLRPVEFHI